MTFNSLAEFLKMPGQCRHILLLYVRLPTVYLRTLRLHIYYFLAGVKTIWLVG